MNSNRIQSNRNTNNYRSGGDGRRPYQNGYRNSNWNDKSRPQTEWRSERESRNGIRNESRQQSSQSPHLPGIPVNRNLSSNAFVANDSKVNNCANGCGDQTDEQKSLQSITKELSQMDLKGKDSVPQTNVTPTDLKEVIVNDKSPSSESTLSATEAEQEIEKIEQKEEKKVVPTNVANNEVNTPVNTNGQRRNTIGSEYRFPNKNITFNERTFRRNGNELNGHKFDGQRFNNFQNRPQMNDKRFNNNNNNNRPFNKKYTPLKNDFVNYMPFNQLVPNMCDPYSQYSQCFYPTPYFPNPGYGYGVPQFVPQNNGEMATELGRPNNTNNNIINNNNQTEAERSGKPLEQMGSDMCGYMQNTHFVPFKPTPEFPHPPQYYGNIISFNTEKGVIYYFQSVIPPNIALLPLDVESTSGLPILPSNCYTSLPFSQ